ncbi:LacI family DNA-binding transcriptional regulator [Mesorhizobium sp. AD1-1]|uniref:LacI family DNA-binding transcriptional regulator n=1 Tax=unclassified Mesorhizobium TaxID=325217 RepID=UPI001CCD85F2|nr:MULTISPECIES: LacI family DNA-binding transcriptional regulator [unclassified Mesorhizobium]MBZ9719315.1 LacI family DNA-binding transcriptional regulator [Mesorhizobium sp. AD1-1]MCA0030502.1 LacI family DNA-binding transcriptional regulator [Mesorhizobium sp. B263B2A]
MAGRKIRDQVTLKDVAAAAGVSVMSVSNVVNERWDLVSERTRAIIENEIKRLKYQPQLAGRSLRTGRTNTIGLIALQGSDDSIRFNRKNQAAISGFLEAISGQGYTVCHVVRSHCPIETAIGSLAQRLDGAALLVDESLEIRKKDIAVLASLGIPVVEIQGLRLHDLQDCCSIHEKSDAQINGLAAFMAKGPPGPVFYIRVSDSDRRALRRYKLLRTHPMLRHFEFAEPLGIIDFLSQSATARVSNVFVSSEIELADVAQGCVLAGRPDVLGQLVCLDAESQSERPDGAGIPGLQSVAFRVGTVAGTSLLGRLNTSAFTYRDIGVDCRLVLPDRARWSSGRSLRVV